MNAKVFQLPNNITEEDLFKKMIGLSIILHVGLVLMFGIKAVFFPHEPLSLDTAVRVDLVGLPDKIAQLPEKPAPAPAPVPPPQAKPEVKALPKEPPAKAPPAKVVLNPKAKAKTLEKIKKLEREESEKKVLDSIKQEVAAEEAKEQRQAKLNQLLKGNAVSPGSALHGLAKTEFSEYLGQLHNHVQQHWSLPEWLQNDTLKATVIVYIDFRGVVLKRVLNKSSGDSRFDDFALKAVDEASPFPQPPAKFVDMVRINGIVLGFPE